MSGTGVPPSPGLHLLAGLPLPTPPVESGMIKNHNDIEMPYWCADGRRLRYITNREIVADSKREWSDAHVSKKMTAENIGQMQCIYEDGMQDMYDSGWGVIDAIAGIGVDPTKKFPNQYVWQPVLEDGTSNLQIATDGVTELLHQKPILNEPEMGKHYWYDKYGAYDAVSRFVDMSKNGNAIKIARYDIISYYGWQVRTDDDDKSFRQFGADFHLPNKADGFQIDYSGINPPPPFLPPKFNYSEFMIAQTNNTDYDPSPASQLVSTGAAAVSTATSTPRMPTINIGTIRKFKLSESSRFSWSDYVTQIDQKAAIANITDDRKILAIVRDNLHDDEKSWENQWFMQSEMNLGRKIGYLEYVEKIAKYRMVPTNEQQQYSKKLQGMDFRTDIQKFNTLFFEYCSRAVVNLVAMESRTVELYLDKLPREIVYAIHQRNNTTSSAEYNGKSWDKFLREPAEIACKQMNQFLPNQNKKRERDDSEPKEKQKTKGKATVAAISETGFVFANTQEKLEDCKEHKLCFDCGLEGHRVGSKDCPKAKERKKLNDAKSGKGRKDESKKPTLKVAKEKENKKLTAQVKTLTDKVASIIKSDANESSQKKTKRVKFQEPTDDSDEH